MVIDFTLLAEVADKEPAIATYWWIAAFLSVVAICLGQLHRLAPTFAIPVATLWACAQLTSSLCDPIVGRGLVKELGYSYVVQACLALALPFVAIVVGTRLGPRSHGQIRGT